PFVVVVIISVIASVLVAPHVDLEPQLREQYEKANMSDEQIEQSLAMVARFQKFQAAVTAVFVPIIILIVAAVFLLLVKMFGGAGGFVHFLSITCYGWIPQVIKAVILTAIIVPRGMIDARQLGTLLRSNPGFLADPVDAPALFSLLSSLDVFTFWTLFLFTIGISEAAGFSRGRAAALVVIPWALFVLGKVGLAAVMGG
ncbi:MAG TPA: YIP1 family protein, partial [Thermoanaerobaculia bacterium]|nr:YIP1 family protein [Thermoanaerobaculia bacterium]